MNTEVHCYECGDLIGKLTGGASMEVHPTACRVEKSEFLFTLECPNCGTDNHVKIKY